MWSQQDTVCLCVSVGKAGGERGIVLELLISVRWINHTRLSPLGCFRLHNHSAMTDTYWHEQLENIYACTCCWTHTIRHANSPTTLLFTPCKNCPLQVEMHSALQDIQSNPKLSLYYACSVKKGVCWAGIAWLPLTAAHLKALLQQPELTLYLRIGHKLRQHLAPFKPAGRSFGIEFKIPLLRSLWPEQVPLRCKTGRNGLARSWKRPVESSEMDFLWWGEHS